MSHTVHTANVLVYTASIGTTVSLSVALFVRPIYAVLKRIDRVVTMTADYPDWRQSIDRHLSAIDINLAVSQEAIKELQERRGLKR